MALDDKLVLLLMHLVGRRNGVVEGSSMNPTLYHGCKYRVKKIRKKPRPGTAVLIIIQPEWNEYFDDNDDFIIKRVKMVRVSINCYC